MKDERLNFRSFLCLGLLLNVLFSGSALAATGSARPSSTESKLTYKLYGLNFGPFIGDDEDPNLGARISENQLRRRMSIIAPYTRWIRTYGCVGLEKAGPIAHELGLKAAIGAWLGRDPAANEREISCLISITKAGHADTAVVGSEVLHRGDLRMDRLKNYIYRVKREVPEEVPVATADLFNKLISHPAVTSAGDVVLANYYPYWAGIKVDQSIAALHAWHQQVKEKYQGKRVIVSETGWPSCGDQIRSAVPSLKNASFYFREFVSWARANDVPYFYFEALDEVWKAKYEGPEGGCWGLFFGNGKLKPGMQDVFSGKQS